MKRTHFQGYKALSQWKDIPMTYSQRCVKCHQDFLVTEMRKDCLCDSCKEEKEMQDLESELGPEACQSRQADLERLAYCGWEEVA